jgi:glycosyltransferase involved in cell wall biosynthesis
MTRRVLGLSTYPITRPRHGGQLRVEAMQAFYRGFDHDYRCAAVYESPAYGPGSVGPDDIKLGHMDVRWQGVPFLGDLSSGTFAAETPAAYAHFSDLIARFDPDIIQLEHPFLWPLVRRLRGEGKLDGVAIVYSSHNWEGPLKEGILVGAGVPKIEAAALRAHIEELEAELVEAASVVIAVSPADADIYRSMTRSPKIVVAPNGTSRPPEAPASPKDAPSMARDLFGDDKFMFFVGSAYPPNIDGFRRLVADGGFYFLPPRKSMIVCGNASEGIFTSGEYQRFLLGNSERVQFQPDVDDAQLWALKRAAHAFLLPIEFGGGTNLKSAEAIASGKWVITTSTALRGREAFVDAPGIVVADTPKAFRKAMIQVMASPPLKLSAKERAARDQVYWDRVMINSGLRDALQALAPRERRRAS